MTFLMLPRSARTLLRPANILRTPLFLRSSHIQNSIATPISQSEVQACRMRFSTSTRSCAKYRTVEQLKARNKMGPTSIYSAVFFILCGVGMYVYFDMEKARMNRKRIREASKGVGKPRIGGAFELVDQNGQHFTSDDMKGKFALIYFGFSHCPDICPDELDKMARMIDMIKQRRGNTVRPIFVTCDPNRDSPAVIKEYLQEFHPDIIGLTGTWEQVRAMCKAYRVYFSTPPNVKPGQDYLVDHSIYFYLMDPEGEFIEVIGREHSAQRGAKVVADHIDKFMGRNVSAESFKEIIPTDLAQRR